MAPSSEESRNDIIRAIDRCLCVEAGAGTGKTTLLVTRIMYMVATGAARLKDIVAITFTEKAAGELKVKLYEKVDAWLEGRFEPYEQELRADFPEGYEKCLDEALSELEICQVSTIHSFAASLIKTRPIEAGIDPGFNQADDTVMFFINRDAWDEWIREKLKSEQELFCLPELADVNLDVFRKLASSAYDNRDLFVERFGREHIPDTAEIMQSLAPAREVLRDRARALQVEVLDRMPAEGGPGGNDPAYRNVVTVIELRGEADELEDQELVTRILKIKSLKGAKCWDVCPVLKEKQRVICDELKLGVGELEKKRRQLIGMAVAGAVLEFIEEVEEAKKRNGLLDFQDLLIKARDMLQSQPEVRDYFKRKYSRILVDEFQDTDPLQADIAFFLAEKEGGRAAEWTDVELEPGKLFIVGDPKQSIYRFRRADIDTYYRARDVMGIDALKYIRVNYRSVPGIIDWVNEAMEPAFGRNYPSARQAEYVNLEAQPGSGDCNKESVLVLRNRPAREEPAEEEEPPVEEKLGAEVLREKEAVLIAEEIKKMVGTDEPLVVRDGSSLRPAKYSDITVLFRKFSNVDTYEQALSRASIPFRTEGGKNFYARQEVVDLRNALCAIDNPYDGVAVLGTLRSFFFALADDELAGFALAGSGFNYLSKDGGGGPVPKALASLKSLHAARNNRTVASTIEALLDETMARESLVVEGHFEQALANLTKLIDTARSLELMQKMSLTDFARWLSDMSDESMGTEESPAEEAGGEYVRLITVHKAKGLEFRVVIIAGVSGGAPSKGFELFTRHAGEEIEFKLGKLVETPGFTRLKEADGEAEKTENVRSFYVAATRARDALRLHDFRSKKSRAWFGECLDAFEEDRDEDIPGATLLENLADYDLMKLATPPGEKIEPEPVDIDRLEADWNRAHELALRTGSEPIHFDTATGFEKDQAPGLPEEEFWPEVTIGMAGGSAMHRVLEAVPVGATDDVVAELAKVISAEEGIADIEPTILRMVNNVVSSEVWARASESGRLLREVPFCVKADGGYMAGKMDLVFMDGGEAVVVDYKSDNVTERCVDDRMAFYSRQGKNYSAALEQTLGRPVKEVIFYFAAPNVTRTLPD